MTVLVRMRCCVLHLPGWEGDGVKMQLGPVYLLESSGPGLCVSDLLSALFGGLPDRPSQAIQAVMRSIPILPLGQRKKDHLLVGLGSILEGTQDEGSRTVLDRVDKVGDLGAVAYCRSVYVGSILEEDNLQEGVVVNELSCQI